MAHRVAHIHGRYDTTGERQGSGREATRSPGTRKFGEVLVKIRRIIGGGQGLSKPGQATPSIDPRLNILAIFRRTPGNQSIMMRAQLARVRDRRVVTFDQPHGQDCGWRKSCRSACGNKATTRSRDQPRYSRSTWALVGCRSLARVLDSICRIRSRVTPNSRPTSSSVRGWPSVSPYRS